MVVKIWAGLAAVAVELSLLGWMVAGRGVDWFLAFCNEHRHFAGLMFPYADGCAHKDPVADLSHIRSSSHSTSTKSRLRLSHRRAADHTNHKRTRRTSSSWFTI